MYLIKKLKNSLALTHYGVVFIGVMLLSFGLFNVHNQSNITEGGILGLTLLIQHWFNISPGISGLILDGICYFLGYKLLGKSFLKTSIFASVSFSLCYNIFERIGYIIPNLSNSPLLAAVLGAIFVGVGVGLVVREGGAAGGDDALALVIRKIMKLEISKIYVVTDIFVLFLSLSYIPLINIIYSLITVSLSSFIIGKLQLSINDDEDDETIINNEQLIQINLSETDENGNVLNQKFKENNATV